MNEKKQGVSQIILFIILVIVALSCIYPIFFMFLSSFKERVEYLKNVFGLPENLYLKNYVMSFEKFNIPRLAFNSLIVTVSTIAVSTLITSMAAFSFAKLKFRGSEGVFTLVIACMMIPTQVLIIPVYMTMSKLQLINNFLSLILFYVTISIPFATFMLTVNCRGIPDEMLQSAEIDGAPVPMIYWKVIVPMLKPSLITLLIINFLFYWNELMYSMMFLQTEATRTMTVAVVTIVQRYTVNMPLLMTGLLLNCIPVIAVFIVFQKYINKGITVGAIK